MLNNRDRNTTFFALHLRSMNGPILVIFACGMLSHTAWITRHDYTLVSGGGSRDFIWPSVRTLPIVDGVHVEYQCEYAGQGSVWTALDLGKSCVRQIKKGKALYRNPVEPCSTPLPIQDEASTRSSGTQCKSSEMITHGLCGYSGILTSWLCFYQTRSAWSRDQGSNKNHSPAYNFAPTVTKFCVMWEGLSLPRDTKFGNCRCHIVDSRVFPIWSLIPGSSWSGLIKAEPGVSATVPVDGLHWSHRCLRRICQSFEGVVPEGRALRGWFQVVPISCRRCLNHRVLVCSTLKRLAPSVVKHSHWPFSVDDGEALTSYSLLEWSVSAMSSLQVIGDVQMRGLIKPHKWKCPVLSQLIKVTLFMSGNFDMVKRVDDESRGNEHCLLWRV